MSWLSEQNASIAFSAYKTGNIFIVGPKSDGPGITDGRGRFTRAMGIAVKENDLFLGTASQIWKFNRIGCDYQGFTTAYLPRIGYTTGDIDIHEMMIEESNRLVFVNTSYSCLATQSYESGFQVIWRPPFISKLAPEDRCHLNGMAARDGQVRYVTMAAQSDVMGQWRSQRHDGGLIMDISTNEIVVQGLSMPHSPRWHENKLWVLNSGSGEFGFVDSQNRFEPVCFCPGYLRGLSFIGKYAVVGLSRLREASRERSLQDLELETKLRNQKMEARCGIYVIDITTGNIEHALNLEGEVLELFDVQVLRGITQTDILDFQSDHVNRMITFEEAA